jgi:hypothetical protein
VTSVATASDARDARKREVQALEELLDQVRALDQIPHEHEQGNGDQDVVRHHRVGALHHQIERLLDRELGIGVCVREPREHHAHAHQRERRGKAEHDRDDDQREHQQSQVTVRHLRTAPA